MEIQVKMQVWNDLTESKEVIERLVWENLNNKLDQYLNKFTKNDAEWIIDINVDKNKKGLFDGKVQANLDWKIFRSEREDFKKLDDLINHLFDHLKLQLSD
jgi:hypothetical protein